MNYLYMEKSTTIMALNDMNDKLIRILLITVLAVPWYYGDTKYVEGRLKTLEVHTGCFNNYRFLLLKRNCFYSSSLLSYRIGHL